MTLKNAGMKGKKQFFEIHKYMWITLWKWWISLEFIDKMRQWILLEEES